MTAALTGTTMSIVSPAGYWPMSKCPRHCSPAKSRRSRPGSPSPGITRYSRGRARIAGLNAGPP